MSAALSIVFTGLCALVTDGERAPGQVLLVDTKGIGEVGGVVLPEHAPTLVANLSVLTNPESSSPSRVVTAWPDQGLSVVDQIGLWDLTGSEVRIRVQGQEGRGLELYRPSPGASSWPEPPRNANDPEPWRDPRYLASMKALTGDGRIDPALVAADDVGPTTLPRGVAARIHLDAGRLEAGVPTQEINRDDIFEFRRTGVASHRQALTDTIRWTLEAHDAVVVVEIIPVAGGPIKRLVLAPNATPRSLFISNLPAGNTAHDTHYAMSSDEMAIPHFGAYYKLLMNEPAEKPLPRLWRARPERPGASGARPVFCGPAVFNRR